MFKGHLPRVIYHQAYSVYVYAVYEDYRYNVYEDCLYVVYEEYLEAKDEVLLLQAPRLDQRRRATQSPQLLHHLRLENRYTHSTKNRYNSHN